MVIEDDRRSIRVIDFLLTKHLMKRTKINFVLSQQEIGEMSGLNFNCTYTILPNGISIPVRQSFRNKNLIPKIIFCSRLQTRKRPELFVELANYSYTENIEADFEIYGPDGGKLSSLLESIRESNNPKLKYMGSLAPDKVIDTLSKSDLLVLPSENEPFPMVVLESLSVGTPVLIMPSCGISSNLSEVFPEMVSRSADFDGLLSSFLNLVKYDFNPEFYSKILRFCRETFSIKRVTEQLEETYKDILFGKL